MHKIVFLIPYYGKWPAYFREWAYTAGYLKDQNIDFLLITDLPVEFPLPENIRVKKLSFSEMQEKAQACFDFPISLNTPYKLCDFRPAFGEIFSEEICGYDFWGHCDIDMVWGNVAKFITDEILDSYDKIQYMGHFVLYRNSPHMNQLFRSEGGIFWFHHVFESPRYYSFDEHPGIMQIVAKHGISNYIQHNQADISPRYNHLVISRVPNYTRQILYWQEGSVYRKYIDETGNVGQDEFMYAHFQKKHPASMSSWDVDPSPKAFLYNAEGFRKIVPEEIDQDFILKNAGYVDETAERRENLHYLANKMKQFLLCSFEEKIIWIKQRIATHKLKQYTDYFKE